MENNFPQCFKWLLENEGGYCNDAGDPGGMTCWGVTHIDWHEWTGHEPSEAEMRALTPADVEPLYKAKYWAKLVCDFMPSGVDYAVFDYGVNSGVGRAARIIQKLVGVVQDGQIGPQTIAAINAADAAGLIEDLCDEREAFLHSLSTFHIFGKGWINRVEQVRERAKGMA
jgi:lysozyme family protein